MARKFKIVDYEQSGQQRMTIDDCLPADHLAHFIVGIVKMLDLGVFYAYYAAVGGEPLDQQVLLALLWYAYATGVFSSRKIEMATYEVIPFRFIAGGLHPDHSTIARTWLMLCPWSMWCRTASVSSSRAPLPESALV